ncbi:MAG: Smc [Parcubacteria group bacterium LiPW_41]|nr:MAG: Smc [Parcubacteria group bacterium LiPW_41]
MHHSTFLRRLELQGFKSFAQKTVFEFPDRVTAVVGPNGSGKSNVIDALRWVLGEREAKQLRGDSLANLIFAGTPKRPAVGFARVSLVFDNSEKLFPIDAPEVTVTRKIDRSGASEFFLNDSEMRLKDLQPILARAKLGSRGLTMIGQGQSDLFVRSTPEDRRGMIEEILGLREFRLKKNQSERQLATSEINMEKVRAMIEEITPHLRLLRRQKSRFERRTEIENELKSFETAYFSHRYHSIMHDMKMAKMPVSRIEEEKNAKEKEVFVAEQEVKAVGQKDEGVERGRALRDSLNELFKKRAELERAFAKAEARIEIESVPITQAEKSAADMHAFLGTIKEEIAVMVDWHEIEKIKISLQSITDRIGRFFERDVTHRDTSDLKKELERIKVELETVGKEIDTLRVAEEELAESGRKSNQEFRAKVEVLENKKNELRKLDQELVNLRFDYERVLMRKEELEREWVALGNTKEELESIKEVQDVVASNDLERKMIRMRGELAAIGEIDPNLMKEAEDTEARYIFLTKELEDLTNAIADLRSLIKELDHKIHADFKNAFSSINDAFDHYFKLMFGGGKAKMKLKLPEVKVQDIVVSEGGEEVVEEKKEKGSELQAGVEIEIAIPRKKITSLEMLSGGEKSLVSLAALFALIAVSPPPFLVLDEIDAPLDEENARRFSDLIKDFSKSSQFVIVTHNRATMEAADSLYGVTMGDDGVSAILSLKLEGTK